MNLSVVVSPPDPDNPVVSDAWAAPVLGIVYFVLVVVALASLKATKWIPAPAKAAVAVVIIVSPFAGSIAWIIYAQARQRARGRSCRRS